MKLEAFIYLYGKFYDDLPENIRNDTIIVYISIRDADRRISSLEGIFVSLEPVRSIKNPLCKRIKMRDFEKEFSGKFYKFSN